MIGPHPQRRLELLRLPFRCFLGAQRSRRHRAACGQVDHGVPIVRAFHLFAPYDGDGRDVGGAEGLAAVAPEIVPIDDKEAGTEPVIERWRERAGVSDASADAHAAEHDEAEKWRRKIERPDAAPQLIRTYYERKQSGGGENGPLEIGVGQVIMENRGGHGGSIQAMGCKMVMRIGKNLRLTGADGLRLVAA